MEREKWKLLNRKGDFYKIARECRVDPLFAKIAVNRGVKEEEANDFFHGKIENLASPYQMKDMEKAVTLILEGLQEKEEGEKPKIAIASDYDSDGLLSAYTLFCVLKEIGYEPSIYIPDRVKEGYGLNERIVEEIRGKKIFRMITCDNGIAAIPAVSLAKKYGMTVIVTDHHEVPFEEKNGERSYILPPADAIINPKQEDCGYPFKKLCGAGVVYRLSQALYERCGKPEEKLYELLPFTAMATVADVMDLLGENRIIVKEGLSRIAVCENKGLQALIRENGLDKERITAYQVGFVLAPCFNAAGRLSSIFQAMDLLMEEEESKAAEKARKLKELNDERKKQTEEGVLLAKEYIETYLKEDGTEEAFLSSRIYLIYLPEIHESIAGIIAGRIREAYHHPVFVFTDAEEGIKGSGRSIEAYNMFEGILKCKELLSHFGGHPMAAGLSLPKENLEELRRRLNKENDLVREDFVPVVEIDAAMPLGYITEELIENSRILEPFGKGNHSPLYAEQHFKLHSARVLGANRNVLKFLVENSQGVRMEAVYFGETEKFVEYLDEEYGEVERKKLFSGRENQVDLGLVYYPEINEYQARKTIQIVVKNYCRIQK